MLKQPLDSGSAPLNGITLAARIFSDVFSPPSVFAAFGFVLAWSELTFWPGLAQGAIYGVLASLLPILTVLYLLKTGRISDIHMSNTQERNLPYVVGLAGSAFAFLILQSMNGSNWLQALALSNIGAMLVLLVVNRFWLVSAHLVGITIITGLGAAAFGQMAGLGLGIIGLLTFSARLYLKRHNIPELLGGILLGAGIVLAVLFWLAPGA